MGDVEKKDRDVRASSAEQASSVPPLRLDEIDAHELLYKAFQLGPAAFSITRLSDGVVVDVNEKYEELTGYTRAALVGTSTFDLDLWVDRARRDDVLGELREEGVVRERELRVRRQDGGIRTLQASLQRVDVQGTPCVLTTAIDITERRHAARMEQESRSLLDIVFRASPSAISITRLTDGRFVDINEAWCTLTGYSREEVLGRTTLELELWADRHLRQEMIAKLREEGVVHEFEIPIQTRAGEVRTVLLSCQRIQVVGDECVLAVTTDITEHKKAMLALAESEHRFRVMADFAPVLIWKSDTENRGTFFNQPWLDFTGRTLEEECGAGWLTSLHPEDTERVIATCQAHFERREPFTLEFRLRRHDDVYRWMLDKGVPRYDPSGAFTGYIGSCVDITERKETEVKLLEAKEHAEDMARLKSTFLTNMTHEIRTPLTVILGFTSILRQGVRKEYQRFVHLIERSGRRLLLMLDSMLDLAQLEAGTLEVEPRPYNLGDVVQGVIATLRTIAEEKGLVLEMEDEQVRVYVQIDHAILTRVLNNLLDNAVKFTEEGRIVIAMRQTEERAFLEIRDTGIGIDARFLPHVFEPFTQESTGLERTHQGSGLGLTVSKRLLELMGGEIEVRSRKGEGSIFTIILPRARQLGAS